MSCLLTIFTLMLSTDMDLRTDFFPWDSLWQHVTRILTESVSVLGLNCSGTGKLMKNNYFIE